MNYAKINTIAGWLCFFAAATTYILTLEQSLGFWDCGEFKSTFSANLNQQVVYRFPSLIIS